MSDPTIAAWSREGDLLFQLRQLREENKRLREALAQPAQEPMQGTPFGGMNRDDWKDVVSAISKVRDSRGIYLACRPADVFQDWFLLFGTGKLKEKNFD